MEGDLRGEPKKRSRLGRDEEIEAARGGERAGGKLGCRSRSIPGCHVGTTAIETRVIAHSLRRRHTGSTSIDIIITMSAPLTSALSSRVNIVQASVRARAAPGSNRVNIARSSKLQPIVAKATPAESSNVVVLGGTGGTGSECVVQALKRGAKVTVLARDPSKMTTPPGTGGAAEGTPLSDPNLTVVKGNVSDAADVAKVITKDTTGIVVSLGGKTKDVGATMLTDGTTNVINAMKAAGIDKDGECFFFSLFYIFA